MDYQATRIYRQPYALPITLAEAKLHLRVDNNEEDTLISALIQAATNFCENWTGRKFVSQQWDAYFPYFSEKLEIPFPPCISIDGVFYKNTSGSEVELDDSAYNARIVSEPAAIFPATDVDWPETYAGWNAVRVRFTAGFPPTDQNSPVDMASGVPAALKAAIKLVIGDLYQNREGAALVNGAKYEANPTVAALMLPYRADMGI
jgi:uncharacterized phiE125 gp8 family phage protein